VAQYIPDHILDRIRSATDIVGLIRESLPLKKAGSAFKALCPFHREKTPSFHVNPERQIFKCFGCGEGGDVFSWIMKTEGVSFFEAAATLAERSHIELPATATSGAPVGEKERLYRANEWAADLFHRWLLEDNRGKSAREYLERRGIPEGIVKTYGLGYSPDAWDALLSEAKEQNASESILLKAGLLIPGRDEQRPYDRFRNRLMFPIRDIRNRVIGFGARALDDSEPKYLNSPETPLFSKGRVLYAIDKARNALREKKQAIVVEGYMDTIAAHQYGIDRTVGVLGTALTRDHVRILRRYVDEAVLVFDADNAGQASANRSIDAFAAEELDVRVVTLPDGLDPDDFLRRDGKEAFLKVIESAKDGVTHKLNRALAGRGDSSLGQSKALDDVLATIALMPNAVTQSIEVKKIAERTAIPEQTLSRRVQQVARNQWSPRPETPASEDSQPRRSADRELLQALLAYPETAPFVRENLDRALLADTAVRALIERLLALIEMDSDAGPSGLLARTQEAEQRQIVERIIGKKDVKVEAPLEWCRQLINKIEARAAMQAAQEHQNRFAHDENQTDAMMAKLHAVREAHRKRGMFTHKPQ